MAMEHALKMMEKKHGKKPINGVPSMAFYALLNNQLVLNPEFGQGHNSHKCGVSMLFSSTASLLCIYVFLPKDSKGRMRCGPTKFLMSSIHSTLTIHFRGQKKQVSIAFGLSVAEHSI